MFQTDKVANLYQETQKSMKSKKRGRRDKERNYV